MPLNVYINSTLLGEIYLHCQFTYYYDFLKESSLRSLIFNNKFLIKFDVLNKDLLVLYKHAIFPCKLLLSENAH